MNWQQRSMFQTTYSVSEVTVHIKELLEVDFALQDLWIEGEISNSSPSSAGHFYFSLKDESARISCVMWRSQVQRAGYLPQDGEQVLTHGRISVYEARGTYQFYADAIQPSGLGVLYRQFEVLKKKLDAEGLFDEAIKRPCPPFPRLIGVVSSPDSAALQDVRNVLSRRFPLATLLLSPTLVQGDQAAGQIVSALEALNARPDVDLVILVRGGGSLEELMPFNDEQVARAIRVSRAPVISGVGHETDYTIADFAADLRAPTPSAAAELAVPDQWELRTTIAARRHRLVRLLEEMLTRDRAELEAQTQRLGRVSPRNRIDSARQEVDELLMRAKTCLRHGMALRGERLEGLGARLQSLSPLATLGRGYALVRDRETDQVITRVAQVRAGDELKVRVSDGEFGARAR